MDMYVGEIRLFAFPRIPDGWLACSGQILSIGDYDLLYSLIGPTYGGDGRTTFALPDLRGRVPIAFGQGPGLPAYVLGQFGGEETHTLIGPELASHSHGMTSAMIAATTEVPGTQVHLATPVPAGKNLYAPSANAAPYTVMSPKSVQHTGGNAAHNNVMPTLAMNFCIAYVGVYPSPS